MGTSFSRDLGAHTGSGGPWAPCTLARQRPGPRPLAHCAPISIPGGRRLVPGPRVTTRAPGPAPDSASPSSWVGALTPPRGARGAGCERSGPAAHPACGHLTAALRTWPAPCSLGWQCAYGASQAPGGRWRVTRVHTSVSREHGPSARGHGGTGQPSLPPARAARLLPGGDVGEVHVGGDHHADAPLPALRRQRPVFPRPRQAQGRTGLPRGDDEAPAAPSSRGTHIGGPGQGGAASHSRLDQPTRTHTSGPHRAGVQPTRSSQ